MVPEHLICTLNQQLFDVRVETLNNYDEILNSMDKFKEELFIKDLKISQLMDDIHSIKAKNDENNGLIQLLQKKFPGFSNELIDYHLDDTCNDLVHNELYEGKYLIVEQINQLEGSDIEAENYLLPDLINMLMRSIISKEEHLESINKNLIRSTKDENKQLKKEINDNLEWQKQLENEIEQLNSEIEKHKRSQQVLLRKENDNNDMKEDYFKIKCIYNNLLTEYEGLKTSLEDYQYQLTQKEIQYVDSNNIIKILQSDLKDQAEKVEQVNLLYYSEKENFQKVEKQVQQLIKEYTSMIHEKDVEIVSIKEECSVLKDHICSTEAEIESLKHNIIILEYALHKKNCKLLDASRELNKLKQHPGTSSLQLNDLLYMLSKLEHQMDVMLDNIYTCNKKIVNYESVLFGLQNSVQQQTKIRKRWIKKYENTKKCAIKEKEVILSQYQEKIEHLKQEHNFTVANLTDKELCLKSKIQDLEKNLKLKSSHLIMAEKIASSQMQEANNIIQQLYNAIVSQSDQLNEMKNRINAVPIRTHSLNSDGRRYQQMECLIDFINKLKLENHVMKKLCQLRQTKIMNLQNYAHN